MQAVQSELQVGAPARHHAGAGHVAELGHCFQQAARQREGEETQRVSKCQRGNLPDSTEGAGGPVTISLTSLLKAG